MNIREAFAAQSALLNNAEMARFQPLMLDKVRVGWLSAETFQFAARFLDLERTAEGIHWRAPSDFVTRKALLHALAQDLLAQGVVAGWRDECLPLWAGLNTPVLAEIERCAAHVLGTLGYGVHLNAYTYRAGVPHLWLSRRSPNKPTAPNKLDQIAAGALPTGADVLETLYREAWEEAGVPKALLLGKVSPVRELRYRAVGRYGFGVRDDVMLMFDVELPADFEPVNQDGEAAAFYCVPLDKALCCAASDEFKLNSAVATLDFLTRFQA